MKQREEIKTAIAKDFIKGLADSFIKRFFIVVLLTLILTVVTLSSLREDPNALKWILLTIWVDLSAYSIGYLSGYRRAINLMRHIKAAAQRDSSPKNDIIGGRGDRHEE